MQKKESNQAFYSPLPHLYVQHGYLLHGCNGARRYKRDGIIPLKSLSRNNIPRIRRQRRRRVTKMKRTKRSRSRRVRQDRGIFPLLALAIPALAAAGKAAALGGVGAAAGYGIKKGLEKI